MNKFLKKVTIFVTFVVSFYIIFYIIFNLLFITNSSYKLGSKKIPFYDKYENDTILAISKNTKEEIVEKSNKSQKILQENLKKLSMIESFNPSIEDDKNPKIDKKVITKQVKTKKPKMVIIIDDVQFPYQVRLLKKINLKLTPSFLPIIKNKKQAQNLTSKFSSYMIHLPLDAGGYLKKEKNTLSVDAPLSQIQQEISKALRLFPNANYVNNHTGSKFTANINAMQRLSAVLKKNNLKFIDSVTTSNSKAQQAFDYKIYKRDIFIDHIDDVEEIKKAIKKAITLSKIKKIVILLGHPRRNTLSVLAEYEKIISKEVDVVFIDEL